MSRWKRVITLLEEWGWLVKIGWWGQVDKTFPDIDELTDYSTVEYISPKEFLAFAKTQPAEQKKGFSKDYQERAEKTSNQKKYIRPIQELPNVGFHVIRRSQNELLERFDALETKRGKEWLKLREFTPDVVINSRYFDYDFKPGENLAINAGLGTGKSYFSNAKWLANPEEGAVLGGYRNCLNEQFCANGEKLNGRPWYQIQRDLKGAKDLALIADPESRIAGAVDSWIYFAPHHFEGKKVIFDEVESVAKHLNQSSTAVSFYRDTIKSRVSDALQNSSANLIADGNLRDFTVEYFEKLSGKKFTKILNKYTGNRGKLYLYNGSSRKRKATESDVEHGLASQIDEWISFDHKHDDCSKLHRIMMDLPTDIPLLILSDSQKKCEAWDEQLSALGRKVFRLDILKLALEKIKAQLLDPHIQYEAKLMLKESFEREYPRFCFEYAAREAGWEVATVESREDDLSDLRATQQEIGKERATAVFGSETVSTTEADKLAKKLNKTPEERNQITKSRLLSKLPGIEQKIVTEKKKVTTPEQIQKIEESHIEKIVAVAETPYEDWKATSQPIPEKGVEVVIEKPAFNPDFIDKVTNQDKAFIPRLESQFFLNNPEICKVVQQHKWHKKLDLLTDPDSPSWGGASSVSIPQQVA